MPLYAGSNPVSHPGNTVTGNLNRFDLRYFRFKTNRFQWSFVQWQGSCLIHSRRGFDSPSSDHASLAQRISAADTILELL